MPEEIDPRFVREGRPLRDWLWELIDPQPPVRRRAENAISAMKLGAPVADANAYLNFPKDFAAHQRDWGLAIAEILDDPDFDGPRFVRTAFTVVREDNRRNDEQSKLEDEYFDSDGPADVEESKALLERLGRMQREQNAGRLPNSSGEYTVQIVLEHAGRVMLSMPELVRENLRDSGTRQITAKALENVGSRAVEFVPEFLAMVDAVKPGDGIHPYPEVLAAIGGDDSRAIMQLLGRASRPGDDRIPIEAIGVLKSMGPRAVKQVPTLVDDLLKLSANPGLIDAVLSCVSQLAPEREDVFERVLERARPSPPEMRSLPQYPQYRYDEVMYRRGRALESLRHFTRFADRAVPVLMEAIDSFKEYDPDWEYENAEHGRVMASLRTMGPAAAVAVPVLARHVRQSDGDWDRPIIQLLGELGPAAREALPALEELRAEYENDEPLMDPPDPVLDPLDWALWRIRGK